MSSWTVFVEGPPKMDLEGMIPCEDSMVITNRRDESASFVQRGEYSRCCRGDMIQATNACMLEISTRLEATQAKSHHENHQARYI